eukprot:16167066-Heterocapsa_arctica.AAC.1
MVVAFPGRLPVPEQQDDGAVEHVDDFERSPVGCRSEVEEDRFVTVSLGLRNACHVHVANPRGM